MTYKYTTTLLCLILLLATACGKKLPKQEQEEILTHDGLLWKISGNGLDKPSYLFGTWHGAHGFADLKILDSVPRFFEAFAATSQFVSEASLTNSEYLKIHARSTQMADTTYAQLLTPAELMALDIALLQYMVTSARSMTVRPHYLMQILIREQQRRNAELDGTKLPVERSVAMDISLERYAKQKGYTMLALDNEEALALVHRPLRAEADELIAMLDQDIYSMPLALSEQYTRSLAAAYRAQDMDKIAHQSARLQQVAIDSAGLNRASVELLMQQAIVKRNQVWMKSIPAYMRQSPSFVAVGVRHLPDSHGLINLLREAGYTVEAVIK